MNFLQKFFLSLIVLILPLLVVCRVEDRKSPNLNFKKEKNFLF